MANSKDPVQIVIKKEQRVVKEKVGDYTVVTRTCIGSGTFRRVCKAEQNDTYDQIAVKEIHISNNKQKNQYMVDMAEREFQILQKLKHHKNVVRVIDCIIEPDTCWIFMEFCNHGGLNEYLENN